MTQKRFMIVPALHEQKFPYASWLFRAILILSAERDRKLEQIRTWENVAGEESTWKKKKRNYQRNDGLAVEFMEVRTYRSGYWMV